MPGSRISSRIKLCKHCRLNSRQSIVVNTEQVNALRYMVFYVNFFKYINLVVCMKSKT